MVTEFPRNANRLIESMGNVNNKFATVDGCCDGSDGRDADTHLKLLYYLRDKIKL